MHSIHSNHITSSQSLSEAILSKKHNKTVSPKTLRKISEKLVQVRQACCMKSSGRKGPIELGPYIEEMNKATDALKQIENQAVYEAIKTTMADISGKFINKVYNRIVDTRKYNIDHTLDELRKISKYNAELKTVPLCKVVSQACNTKLVDFSCLDSFFSYIKNESSINIMAITKMVRKEGNGDGHYSCIHLIKENDEIKLAVHEPSMSEPEAKQGIDNLRSIIKEHIHEGKLNANFIKVAVVDKNAERKENDKGKLFLPRYFTLACKLDGRDNLGAITIAAQLRQSPKEIQDIFSLLNHNGDKFTFLSQKSKRAAGLTNKSEIRKSNLTKSSPSELNHHFRALENQPQKFINRDASSNIKKDEKKQSKTGRFIKYARVVSPKAEKTSQVELISIRPKAQEID